MAKIEKSTVGPLHPGQFVRTQIIDPLGFSVTEAAEALGVHRVALSRLLNEQAALSPEMAIRLQKAFGANFEKLMRMQNDFDIYQAKLRFDTISVDAKGRQPPANIKPYTTSVKNQSSDYTVSTRKRFSRKKE